MKVIMMIIAVYKMNCKWFGGKCVCVWGGVTKQMALSPWAV